MRLLEERNIQFEENFCYNALFNHSVVMAVIFTLPVITGYSGSRPLGLGCRFFIIEFK
jgi:hypothetical protein